MFNFPKHYGVIVIGGGHAGIEASLASARMGCDTLLITLNLDSIGQMSCNPAVGGLAKGTLAREVDALGGEIAISTDMCGLQFRMLNKTKGPAVWSPRAQCDKKAYQARMKLVCERQLNLDIIQAHATRITAHEGKVSGVQTSVGIEYRAKAVVVTTGTFLNGLVHVGKHQTSGGRFGDGVATELSSSLIELGLELGRLKTGTPPRILSRSIAFSKTLPQHGDSPIPFFTNWIDDLFHVEQTAITTSLNGTLTASIYPPSSILSLANGQSLCHLTHTTPDTARIVMKNLADSPLYSGIIKGTGPRYCPSIEDKVVRFTAKKQHQIFLEPEGIDTEEIYVNGLSTSLPVSIQLDLVRSLVGCEDAVLLRPAYAVEYDFAYPTQLQASLETKACVGLFLAGQINGTSGYEEAAAQGIVAGINACRHAKHQAPIIIRRDQGYIGVLLDDLVSKGTREPYRMFTSRAEYRLLLRQDNADLRLSRIGYEVGLLSNLRFARVQTKEQAISKEMSRLAATRSGSQTLAQILSRPSVRYDDLPSRDESLRKDVIQQVEVETKYAGYIRRQYTEAEHIKALEDKGIPLCFDYSSIPSLRLEARQKLSSVRPRTLGQASRISGVSPSDLSVLAVWLKRMATART